MMPIRENELRNYKKNEIDGFYSFLDKYINDNVVLLDFSKDRHYILADYTDITHFNEAAATRFSKQLNDSIKNRLGKSMIPSVVKN
jgi:hypothetical protein